MYLCAKDANPCPSHALTDCLSPFLPQRHPPIPFLGQSQGVWIDIPLGWYPSWDWADFVQSERAFAWICEIVVRGQCGPEGHFNLSLSLGNKVKQWGLRLPKLVTNFKTSASSYYCDVFKPQQLCKSVLDFGRMLLFVEKHSDSKEISVWKVSITGALVSQQESTVQHSLY